MNSSFKSLIGLSLFVSTFLSCSNLPSSSIGNSGYAKIVTFIRGEGGSRITSWNQMIIKVSADSVDDITDTLTFSDVFRDTVISTVIDGISVGEDRSVTIFTISSNGDTVNGPLSVVKDVVKDDTTTFSFPSLDAVKGSIIIQLADTDNSIKKGSAKFITPNKTYLGDTSNVSAGKLNFSIDYIPNGEVGNLIIFALDGSGNEIIDYGKTIENFKFISTVDTSIVLNWSSNVPSVATVSTEIGVKSPGITAFVGIMDSNSVNLEEAQSGELIISEIQAKADEEFIEIYNSSSNTYTGNLTLDIIKTSVKSYDINSVSIASGDYFVVGAEDTTVATYVDKCIPTISNDIASTGALLILRDSSGGIIDRVYFLNDINYGWYYKTNCSFVLTKLNALDNDFGKNWQYGTTIYKSSSQDLGGTPNSAGR